MATGLSRARLYLVGRLAAIPRDHFLKRLARSLGVGRWLGLSDKYYSELSWQNRWAPVFAKNREKVREYWQKYRYFDEILAIVSLDEHSRVLDVGCGISTVLHFLPGQRFGIDPLADEYKRIYSYPAGIEVRQGYGEQIPFPDQWFDAVFCSNVLDHTSEPDRVLAEIRRVLRPTGFLVLTVEVFPHAQERDLSHPHAFTREEVLDKLSAFQVLFQRESPWIMLMHYVDGSMRVEGEQLILVARKK